jgi:uncharacterized protein (TIGR02996 family)
MARSSTVEGAPIDPEARSFFRAIKENPDDDSPRLILADWLQERGDAAMSARGEFLRLKVLRHRLSPKDPSYDLLKRREGELFTEHRWTWLGPLVDAAKAWTFERGMIQITARAGNFLTPEMRAWTQTPAALWVDALTLIELAQRHILELAYCPLLANVNRLDLSDNGNPPGFSLLFQGFRSEGSCFLMYLNLARNRLPRNQIQPLLCLPGLRGLQTLDLEYNRLDDVAAHWLAESLHVKNVAELRLGHNRFTPEGIALLRDAFGERVHF